MSVRVESSGANSGKVGQIGSGAQTELLQKRARRGVKRGVARRVRGPRLAHEALFHQGVDGTVRVHAAHARHLSARRGLGIRHDRERFHSGLGELARVPGKDVLLDELVVSGMRVQPPAARHFTQLDTAVFGLELVAKPHKGALDIGGGQPRACRRARWCPPARRSRTTLPRLRMRAGLLQTFEHGYSSSPTDVSASSPVRSSSPTLRCSRSRYRRTARLG